MKKLLANKTYLSMTIGILISYILLVVCFFIKSTTAFTCIFLVNIIVNFGVIIYNSIKNDDETVKYKSLTQTCYVAITLLALVLDVFIVSKMWNLTNYDYYVYLGNAVLYLIIYSLLQVIILLMYVYYIIKDNTKRQDSTK
jgi:hypothetical protein